MHKFNYTYKMRNVIFNQYHNDNHKEKSKS